MKIIAFAGSNSSNSINKKLVSWVSELFPADEKEIIDLNDYEAPLYGIDREKRDGIPSIIHNFSKRLETADLILLSLAEHNGAYTVAFKNILDWTSRIPQATSFHNKPIFLMGTSPGRRGASTVIEIAKNRLPFNGGHIVGTFSLPSFADNFDEKNGITDIDKLKEIKELIDYIPSTLAIEKK